MCIYVRVKFYLCKYHISKIQNNKIQKNSKASHVSDFTREAASTDYVSAFSSLYLCMSDMTVSSLSAYHSLVRGHFFLCLTTCKYKQLAPSERLKTILMTVWKRTCILNEKNNDHLQMIGYWYMSYSVTYVDEILMGEALLDWNIYQQFHSIQPLTLGI